MEDFYSKEIATQQPQQAQGQPQNQDFYSQEIAPTLQQNQPDYVGNMANTIASIYQRNSQDNTTSPLHLVDSMAFGLADDAGKEKLLRSKFPIVQKTQDGNYAVGDNPDTLKLVNPQGIFNDVPTKIAQHIGDINTITDSIVGATLGGATMGVPGAMGGSALGGGFGTIVNKAVAKSLGLNTQSPQALATDVALDTALMGAGEGVGQAFNFALKSAGKAIASKGTAMAEQLIKSNNVADTQKATAIDFWSHILNFGTGWDREDISVALANGAKNTFSTDTKGAFAGLKKGSSEHALKLIDMIQNAAKQTKENLSMVLGKAEKDLRTNVDIEHAVNSADVQQNILQQLQSLNLGKIVQTETGEAGTPVISFQAFPNLNDAKSKQILQNFGDTFKDLGGKVFRTNENLEVGRIPTGFEIVPNAKVDLDTLFKRSSIVERQIEGATKEPSLERALISVKHGNIKSQFGEETRGITDSIADIAKSSGDTKYLAAKDAFKNFATLLDEAKLKGIDFNNPVSIQGIMKSGASHSPLLADAIKAIDQYQGTTFANQMAMWKSAYTSQNLNPNFLRFNMVLGLTGLAALKSESLPGKLAYIGAGIGIGTPYGASRTLLPMIERGIARTGSKAVGKSLSNVSQAAILRRLLTQSAAKGLNNKVSENATKGK